MSLSVTHTTNAHPTLITGIIRGGASLPPALNAIAVRRYSTKYTIALRWIRDLKGISTYPWYKIFNRERLHRLKSNVSQKALRLV